MASKQNGKPVEGKIDLGGGTYNGRIVEDYGDGRVLVEHSVFTGKNADRRFIGNVQTILYRHDENGRKRILDDLNDFAKAERIIQDRNRQALSDSKNTFRSEETREASPFAKLRRALSGDLTVEQRTQARKALDALGIDPDALISK